MSETVITTENVPGLPNWIDLGSPNPAEAAEFYGRVFGWTAEPAGPEPSAGDYLLLGKDGKNVAGLGRLDDPNAASAWMTYVRVADGEAAVKRAEELGGAVRVPFMEVGPDGGFAQLTDPGGAEFAVWQPGAFAGVERCCQDDSLLWVGLWTNDPEAAKRFYGEMFAWKTEAFDDTPDAYPMWTTAPGDGMAAFGGTTKITPDYPVQDEKWLPYFMVADADDTVARVQAAGGTVLVPASDLPPGRIAFVADPFGAGFFVMKPMPVDGN